MLPKGIRTGLPVHAYPLDPSGLGLPLQSRGANKPCLFVRGVLVWIFQPNIWNLVGSCCAMPAETRRSVQEALLETERDHHHAAQREFIPCSRSTTKFENPLL